jgi:hypothetical protein
MKCALCGSWFDERDLACHGSCPMTDRCAIVCCPSCGYQTVDDSRMPIANAVRRWAGRISGAGRQGSAT